MYCDFERKNESAAVLQDRNAALRRTFPVRHCVQAVVTPSSCEALC
jgi:hypothetical protein